MPYNHDYKAHDYKDFNPILNPWRICFSRGGFHPDLVAEAAKADNRIILVDLGRLYRR